MGGERASVWAHPGCKDGVKQMKNHIRTESSLLSHLEPEPAGTYNLHVDSPWLFLCEHACNRIPQSLNKLGLPQSEIDRHIGWDIGILDVAKGMVKHLKAPLIFQQYSRLVIDCNRSLENSDLIPVVSEKTQIPGNQNLETADRENRINEIWKPYQQFIKQYLLNKKCNRVVSMHSFTPVFKGKRRPWHIGLLYNRDKRMALALKNILKKHDPSLIIGMNNPYTISGEEDYTIPEFGEATGLPHVLVEVRQDLINKKQNITQWIDLFTRAYQDLENIFTERKIN